MIDDYKRQIDFWIKASLVLTPLLSAAVSYGVIKTTVGNVEARLLRVEQWVNNQTVAMIDAAKAAGQSAEQQKEMNRRLERIEIILDSRLKR